MKSDGTKYLIQTINDGKKEGVIEIYYSFKFEGNKMNSMRSAFFINASGTSEMFSLKSIDYLDESALGASRLVVEQLHNYKSAGLVPLLYPALSY